jgi:hypothetical protein
MSEDVGTDAGVTVLSGEPLPLSKAIEEQPATEMAITDVRTAIERFAHCTVLFPRR